MKRADLFVVSALALALDAGVVVGQDNRGASDLNVSITLESASQSRAAVANLELPLEQGLRSSPAPLEQERRFEPADFARPNRLEAVRIAAGDLPRGTTAVAVRCQAFIDRDGSRGEYFCVSDDNRAHEGVVTAVIDAVPTQRFVAARVDGQSVRVLMNFAVYIDCSSGSCIAVAGRNHGFHLERLGLDYVDPQPILERDDWYLGFDYKLRWWREWMPRIRNVNRWDPENRLPYVMAVEIDASGVAAPGCLYWVGISNPEFSPFAGVRPNQNNPARAAMTSRPVRGVPPRTLEHIERAIASLGSVRYVPGMIDGAPMTLSFYEQSLTTLEGSGGGFGARDVDCD